MKRKTWWLRTIPGHWKYIPWRHTFICTLSRCFDLPSIVSNNNQQSTLYNVPPLRVTSSHALHLIFVMKRSSFNTHYFFYHYCIDSSWEKSAANHPLMIKSAINCLAARCVFGKLIPFPPLSASQPVRVSSVWRVTSLFWPLLKANYVGLFSDWGACQYHTTGVLSLAPCYILIHEP